ncbi:MAG TPA: HDOD domain-containing protein [Candidatus Krumholzibacteria bacterium]|nr:HDOD domain-containing protein [Candidatus Krumholzibacteria bacterium]HRX49939.1 HDOD domain-containing protein [Candidatus Krumholzibacteria bacterium]
MIQKRDILKRVSSVPPLPAVLMKLRACCMDPDADFAAMARVIETDPGLTANLLRLANSAYFGARGTIGSVSFAISRLGLKRVHQIALAVCVAPIARRTVRGYGLDPDALWEHSLATAMAAEHLAADLPAVDKGDAFTAGLLHDMGKLILGMFVEDEYREIQRLVAEDECSFDEAERSVLGTDHAGVGAMILRHWDLPASIVDAVRWHHHPSGCQDHPPLVDLIHVADILCMDIGWGQGLDGLQYRQDEGAASRLGITNARGEEVVCRVLTGLEELKQLLDPVEEGVH